MMFYFVTEGEKLIGVYKWFLLMIMIIAVLNFIKSFCYMCSQVEHYFCFYLIFFLYDFDVPRRSGFLRCAR